MNLKRIGNKIYDGLYYFWYGYRRAKATGPLFKEFSTSTRIPVESTYPEYLKPPQPRLRVNTTPPVHNPEFSKAFSQSHNGLPIIDYEAFSIDVPSRGKVWVYNVSKVTHALNQRPLGKISIPGNTTRKRYSLWTSFPSIMKLPSQKFGDNGEIVATAQLMDGRRFAMDLINPDNLGLDQTSIIKNCMSIGRNLGVRGVFWSEHNPPKKAEVDAATSRLETFYKDLLERAEIMYQTAQFRPEHVKQMMEEKKVSLEYAVRILRISAMELTPEHHAAAEWFKVMTPWHPVLGGKHV